MGAISVDRQHLDRLLAGQHQRIRHPHQRAFAEFAATHRGRPADEILPLLRVAVLTGRYVAVRR